jgi:hypothetical protein
VSKKRHKYKARAVGDTNNDKNGSTDSFFWLFCPDLTFTTVVSPHIICYFANLLYFSLTKSL